MKSDYKLLVAIIFLAAILAVILLSPAKPVKSDCVIGEDGQCTVTVKAPSKPGIYVYTACIDLNGNGNVGEEGECTSASIEVRES